MINSLNLQTISGEQQGQGEVITLNKQEYTVLKPLGSGAAAVAQLAQIQMDDGTSQQVVIRKDVPLEQELSSDDESEGGKPESKSGVERETAVLRKLSEAEGLWTDAELDGLSLEERMGRIENRPHRIAAYIDSGTASDGSSYLVQEYLPEPYFRENIESLGDEVKALDRCLEMAEAMQTAHKAGIAFKDFNPATKMDKFRLFPDGRLGVIDFNITGDKSDFSQDLVFLSGGIYYGLVNDDVDVSNEEALNRLPKKGQLGMGVPSWLNISRPTQRMLAEFLSRDQLVRPRNIDQIVEKIAEVKEMISTVSHWSEEQFRARVYNPRFSTGNFQEIQKKLDQISVYRRANGNDEMPEWLEEMETSYKEALAGEVFVPVVQAKVYLTMGHFHNGREELVKSLSQLEDYPNELHSAQMYLALYGFIDKYTKAKKANISKDDLYLVVKDAVFQMADQDASQLEATKSQLPTAIKKIEAEYPDQEGLKSSLDDINNYMEAWEIQVKAYRELQDIEGIKRSENPLAELVAIKKELSRGSDLAGSVKMWQNYKAEEKVDGYIEEISTQTIEDFSKFTELLRTEGPNPQSPMVLAEWKSRFEEILAIVPGLSQIEKALSRVRNIEEVMRDRVTQQTEKYREIQVQNEELGQRNSALEAQVKALNERNSWLEADVEKLKQELAEVKSRNVEQEQLNAQLRLGNSGLTAQVKTLERELAEVNSENEEQKQLNAQLNQHNSGLKANVKELTRKLNELKSESIGQRLVEFSKKS